MASSYTGTLQDQSPPGSPLEGLPTGSQSTLDSEQPSLVIPTVHKSRTLVLCFDGTGDQFDADNSNIVELFSMLSKSDPDNQMVYYQAGIGTYTSPQIATPVFAAFSKALDEAVAWNLDAHIMDGYEFLMQNYKAKDRICIFGFSRGAYTARCLAGMLHKVGLLPPCNHQQVPFAYKMYTREDEIGWKQSNAFKKAFSIDVDIEFLGVWDTVNSVGIIPRRLPFSTSNTIVRTFRHAMALDERRAKFKVNLWNRPEHHEELLGITDQKIAQLQSEQRKAKDPKKKNHHHNSLHVFEKQYSTIRTTPTDVEEVWFVGCHCDVGGGSVANEVKPNLARISLRWMIRECFKTETGIIFQKEGLRSIGLDPETLYPIVLPRPAALAPPSTLKIQRIPTGPPPSLSDGEADILSSGREVGTEEEHDLADALSPEYDQLSLRKFWWLGEILPMRQRYQRNDNSWGVAWGWNLGSGRYIPKQNKGVKVHRSVKTRMEAEFEDGEKYFPRANLKLDKVIWVD